MNLPADLLQTISETRARVRFRFPLWLRLVAMRDVAGITLGRNVFLAHHVKPSEAERLLRHELTHVRQVIALGVFRFYWRYLKEYIRNLRAGMSSSQAYRNISFELEATAAETQKVDI